MKNALTKFWANIKSGLEMRPAKASEFPPIMPEMQLKDMMQYQFSGEYLFHGSPIKLEPGTDILEAKEIYFRLKLFLAELPMALRFALVRKWGRNQLQATDFYVFADKKYKLVIYDGMLVGASWYRQPDGNETYLYMVRRSDIEKILAKRPKMVALLLGAMRQLWHAQP